MNDFEQNQVKERITEVLNYLKERIEVYNQFFNENIKGKNHWEIDTLDMTLLNGYSAEKEMAEKIIEILQKP